MKWHKDILRWKKLSHSVAQWTASNRNVKEGLKAKRKVIIRGKHETSAMKEKQKNGKYLGNYNKIPFHLLNSLKHT